MKNTGVAQFLLDHAGEKPVSFHMPGHKGSDIYRRYGYDAFINNFIDCDITEIPGADNLFQAEGIIKETADRYKDLYDVKKSYLLINGTSGGLICAASIIPYPPGIPFVCPGEEIGREEIEYIKLLRNRGEKVIGVDENMCVVVGKEG